MRTIDQLAGAPEQRRKTSSEGGNRRAVTAVSMLGLLVILTACTVTSSKDRVLFDGRYFRASAKHVDKKAMPNEFTVTVSDVSASLDGAREAGRYEGTKFCITNFGSSRIAWKVGPETEPQNLRIENDKLTFAGACQRP